MSCLIYIGDLIIFSDTWRVLASLKAHVNAGALWLIWGFREMGVLEGTGEVVAGVAAELSEGCRRAALETSIWAFVVDHVETGGSFGVCVDGAEAPVVPTFDREAVDARAFALRLIVGAARVAGLRNRSEEPQEELPLDIRDAWEAVVNVHVVRIPVLRSTCNLERPEVNDGKTEAARELVHESSVARTVVPIAKRVVFGLTKVTARRRGHDGTAADASLENALPERDDCTPELPIPHVGVP